MRGKAPAPSPLPKPERSVGAVRLIANGTLRQRDSLSMGRYLPEPAHPGHRGSGGWSWTPAVRPPQTIF